MKTTSLQLIRSVCMTAVLAFITSVGSAQAAPGAAGHPMKVKPMKPKDCLDHPAAGPRHARKHETPLKGIILQQTECARADFDGDGTIETQCSTTTHTYDKKGNRISSLTPSSDPNFPPLRVLFTYDKKGNQLTATYQYLQDSNGDGLPDLDADGLPVVISTEGTTTTYDERGNAVAYTYSSGSYLYSQTSTYDAFNNTLTSVSIGRFSGVIRFAFSSSFENTYDCKGNLIGQLVLDDNGNDGDVDSQSQSTFTYDSKGHLLTTFITYSDPSLGTTLFTDTYDKKGNKIASAYLQDQNGNGLLDLGDYGFMETYTYDKEGRLILTQADDDYEGDGVSDFSFSVQYAY